LINKTNFSWSLSDRATYLLTFPVSAFDLVPTVVKGTIGIIGTIGSLATFGKNPTCNRLAKHSSASAGLINEPLFIPFMKIVNPKFNYSTDIPRLGLITKHFACAFFSCAKEMRTTENSFFSREIVSRSAYLTGALPVTVARTVDLALGVIAALGSIVTLGTRPKVNTFAIQHLASTVVIADLCYAARGFVNPHQFSWGFVNPHQFSSGV